MKEFILKYDEKAEFHSDEKCYVNELSNTTKDEEVSIARIRLEPGVTTNWHRLRNTTERYVILYGSGIVEIGELPQQAVTEGDIIVISPMCKQRISNNGKSDLIFLAICTPRFVQKVYEDLEQRITDLA